MWQIPHKTICVFRIRDFHSPMLCNGYGFISDRDTCTIFTIYNFLHCRHANLYSLLVITFFRIVFWQFWRDLYARFVILNLVSLKIFVTYLWTVKCKMNPNVWVSCIRISNFRPPVHLEMYVIVQLFYLLFASPVLIWYAYDI